MDKEPCSDCRKLIDRPATVEPHDGLHTFGTSKVLADFDTDDYKCRDCGTKFKREEAKPSRAVTWTQPP